MEASGGGVSAAAAVEPDHLAQDDEGDAPGNEREDHGAGAPREQHRAQPRDMLAPHGRVQDLLGAREDEAGDADAGDALADVDGHREVDRERPWVDDQSPEAVSYTHLTLPTK